MVPPDHGAVVLALMPDLPGWRHPIQFFRFQRWVLTHTCLCGCRKLHLFRGFF